MVPIELDKTRNLHFGLGAIRDLEAALGGRPLGSLIQDLSLAGINVLVIALYHGLKHEDKGLNPKLVERMLEVKLKEPSGSLRPFYDALPKALDATGIFRSDDDAGKSAAQGQNA